MDTRPMVESHGNTSPLDDTAAAWAAHELLHRDLDESERQARQLTSSPVPEAAAVARWTLGKVHYERSQLGEARRTLRSAISLCRRRNLPALEGAILVSLAAVLVESGQTDDAIAALYAADPLVTGVEVGRLAQQRAFVWYHLGEWKQATDACHIALPIIHAAGDRLGEARLVLLRGVSHLGAGEYSEAVADFVTARALALRIGERLIAALAEHDLGCALGRQGNIPDALTAFDRARKEYQEHGDSRRLLAILDADLAEILLLGGLTSEAVEAAERSASAAAEAGNVVHEAEGRLMTARTLLADGVPARALEAARRSAVLFRRSRRAGWAAYANYIALRSEMSGALAPPLGRASRRRLLHRAEALADTLLRHGWDAESMLVHTDAAQLAHELGDVDTARHHLAAVTANAAASTLSGSIITARAKALLCIINGDNSRALSALRRGLDMIDRHRALLGATELRVGAGIHADDFGQTGFRLALAAKRPAPIFEWSELWRTGALRLAPARPPDDPDLSAAFALWRHLTASRADAPRERHAQIDRTLGDVERSIAQLTRKSIGAGGEALPVPTLREIRANLGDGIMLAYTELDGRLIVQRIDRRRAEVFDLGPSAPIFDELAYASSALRRMATFREPASAVRTPGSAVDLAVGNLDRALLGAVGEVRSRTVIVPSSGLLATPFGALPSIRSLPFTMCPSATVWLARIRDGQAAATATAPGSVSLVAGPGLSAAAIEIAAIGTLHRGARHFVDGAATVANVAEAFTTSDLVHVAAHGSFRRDNPLFSAILCDEGPLSVYDIERLGRVPGRIMLSACAMAGAGARPGGEVIGTATALLHLGSRSIIAPLEAVDDATTATFALEVHRALADGLPPAEALARARSTTMEPGADPMLRAIAAVFTCIGI